MWGDEARVKYTGSTPGADSNTYNLYTTVDSPLQTPQNFFALLGIHKVVLDLKANQAGTLKWYKSPDRGVTWNQIGQESVAALASTVGLVRDYVVSGLQDFKLDWVNSGSAQNPWEVDITLSSQRALA